MNSTGYPSKELITVAQSKYKSPGEFVDWVNRTWDLKLSPYNFINQSSEQIACTICKELL